MGQRDRMGGGHNRRGRARADVPWRHGPERRSLPVDGDRSFGGSIITCGGGYARRDKQYPAEWSFLLQLQLTIDGWIGTSRVCIRRVQLNTAYALLLHHSNSSAGWSHTGKLMHIRYVHLYYTVSSQ